MNNSGSIYHFIVVFSDIILLAVILYIIPNICKKVIQSILLLYSFILCIIELFVYYKFDRFSDRDILEIVIGTNPYTVKEFFVSYLSFSMTIFIVILVASLSYLLYKIYSLNFCEYKHLDKITSLFVIIMVFSPLIFFLHQSLIRQHDINRALKEKMNVNTLLAISNGYNIMDAMASTGSRYEVIKYMDNNPPVVNNSECDIPYVIFILGESNDRNAMQLYGYHNETTPYMYNLYNNGELIYYTDVISPAPSTFRSMSMIFTCANKESEGVWYEYENIFDILKVAKINTIWISNQSRGNYHGNADGIYADRCYKQYFTSPGSERPYDKDVLPLLDNSLKNDVSENNFYVVHLTGTHEQYEQRYPEQFKKFTEVDEVGEKLLWREIKATYDNAMLYNDYITNEIIKRFNDKDALIVYISDHGSEVCDGSDFFGHSDENKRNRHMIEIPMFFWGSKEFRTKHPDLWNKIIEAQNYPFRIDDMIYPLLSIMNIDTPDYDETRDILSKQYVARKRIYGGVEYTCQ